MAKEVYASPTEISRRLRAYVLSMAYAAGSGHCGGSLSAVEILTVLYFDQMNLRPERPDWPERDRFIASKGHCAPALYAALALRGFFCEDELKNLRKAGHFLQGHPDMKKVPGVDMSTGSLGMGLSVGVGMALAARLDHREYYVYVLMGCGEQQEGQVWEAAMAGAGFGLDRLIAILDYNGVQLDGRVQDIMPLGDIAAKWRTFGWNVLETDGHDAAQLAQTIGQAKARTGKPSIVIARTIKGKGVSFMEHHHEWHGRPLDKDTYNQAMLEVMGKSTGSDRWGSL